MSRSGGENISHGIIARITRGVRYAITGDDSAWFGPSQPMAPMAQEAKGRQYDYPFASNLNYKPKVQEGTPFEQLRNTADGCDILRSVIETRKDQVAALKWGISPRDESKEPDDACKKIEAFFRIPDGENSWETWTRMLLEDMFVIDAATLYPRLTVGGDPLGFDIMDGATIKRLIRPDGRTPVAPEPAYQQILKGVPAVDYSADELIYRPRNKRSNRSYGFSQVEQLLTTINILLRKDLSALSYYTQGTIPDGFLMAPDEWQQDQVAMFQKYFDDLLAGNLAARRGAYVLPGSMKYQAAKTEQLKDEMYEWLARIICYVFSVPPTPFIKQMNRATAQTSQETAEDEGVAPLKLWVKSLIDFLIEKYFKRPDLEFAWAGMTSTDPLVQAQIDQIYINAKVKTPNEVRKTIGLEPIEGGDEVKTDPVPAANPEGDDPKKPDDEPPATKLRKKKDLDVAVPRNTPALTDAQKQIESVVTDFFNQQGKDLGDQAAEQYDKLTSLPDSSDAARIAEAAAAIVEALKWTDWDKLPDLVQSSLQSTAEEGADIALAELSIDDADILNVVNEGAVTYAHDRATEMIGKKWVDGVLVDNPDAQWAITTSTRDAIKAEVEAAIKSGISMDDLAANIAENYAFSKDRAMLIARTEVVNAAEQGVLISWRESGVVVGKRVLLAADPCAICVANADEGAIPLDQPYKSGAMAPVFHPRCECSQSPVTNPDELTGA